MPEKAQTGQYYLLERISQGGMAEIYKGLAYDLAGIKKTVCIKKIMPHIAASREFIDMLIDEAKIAVNLNHGNIAQIYDLGKAGEDYFIVMEYVEGQTLSKIFKKAVRTGQKIPVSLICHIIAEVANGLNYMHRKTDEAGTALNIIHRDISPQNIMVSLSGTVKIIDFGIAKAAVKVGHTESGIVKGKFAYMSPEQAKGDPLDHRSDIFSLGILFHELLTGARLFKGPNNKETLKNVKRAKVTPPSKIDPNLPGTLDPIVLKALEKDRRLRYSFASDLKDEILKFLHAFDPDFRPAQLALFVRELFAEELSLIKNLGLEEPGTPHLLLEKTEVTSARSAGINWKDYLLEAPWLEEKPSENQEKEMEESEESREEKTDKKWLAKLPFQKQVWIWSLILAGILGMVAILRWNFSDKPQPSSASLPTPPTAVESLSAKLSVQSNPAGAKIFLDDQETGRFTPSELENLEPNKRHTLGLFLKRHKFFKTDFEAAPGQTQNFHIELALDYGSLKISSDPPGATLFINGEAKGTAPLLLESLEPETVVKIEASLEGYAPFTQELLIEPGRQHQMQIKLERH